MSKYAANTQVPADRSRAEIEKILSRYGADRFMYGWEDDRAVIMFRADGRNVRFILPLPDKNDPEIMFTETGKTRTNTQGQKAYEQAVRQRWRALTLVIKAKLEAVETGIVTFEDEFLAHILLPDNTTVSDFITPQIEKAYSAGIMPSILPSLPEGSDD